MERARGGEGAGEEEAEEDEEDDCGAARGRPFAAPGFMRCTSRDEDRSATMAAKCGRWDLATPPRGRGGGCVGLLMSVGGM